MADTLVPAGGHRLMWEAILVEVLERFPTLLSRDEIVRNLVARRSEGRDPELCEEGVEEMCRVGLLREGSAIEPTLALIWAHELLPVRVMTPFLSGD